jgi:predicted kinase
MEVQRRTLVVICGMPTTGKTTLTQALKEHFVGDEYRFISMDEVREKTWGSKKSLTGTEHMYKNRVTERAAQNAFIVDEATCVFYDAVMLTREAHQKPLMAMVMDTENLLSQIQEEKGVSPATVEIDVIGAWLTCPAEVIKQRLEARFDDPDGLHSVDMDAWYALERRFEDIMEFDFLKFDTSEISLEDLAQKVVEYIQE